MKKITIPGSKLLLLCLLPLLVSCRSSKSIQNEIRGFNANLYYELTSPEYKGKVKDNVYLNFIDYSNLDYYTSVKKKGTLVIPLILFNYCTQRFQVTLGEGSLTQNYREFLTQALLAECNSSTCFNLVDNADSIAIHSDYKLDVKIVHNRTTSQIKLKKAFLILPLPFGEDEPDIGGIGHAAYKIYSATTGLTLSVSLYKSGESKFEKNYHVKRNYIPTKNGHEISYGANRDCMSSMAESLSYATKEIVEQISQDLHLFFIVQ